MTSERFNALLRRRLNLIKDVLGTKNAEYNSGDDRLSNFKRSAELLNESSLGYGDTLPVEEAASFMRKHIISVFDLINERTLARPINPLTIDEKIGDAINYLILIEMLLRENV